MTKTFAMLVVGVLFVCSAAYAQEPVRADPDHQAMLASSDAQLAANKRLVYDFWREVFEGGHLELADKYLAESYIQHNPNVPTGRAGFVTFFSTFVKPKPIEVFVKAPLVSITAERDLVVINFVKETTDPTDSARNYTTTWFDMFRVSNGKIVEHWDAATRR